MASIEEVKAALAQAADQGNTTVNQIQGSGQAAREYSSVLG